MRYLLLVVVLSLGCHSEKPLTVHTASGVVNSNAVPVKETAKKTYTRDEFKTLVTGKTQEEVTKLLGKPNRTDEVSGEPIWRYDSVTSDPNSQTPDSTTTIWFDSSKKAVKVTF